MYSIIGFIDDYLIVIKKNNQGISAKSKMFFQIIWSALYFFVFLDKGMSSNVNLFGLTINLKWGYGILILLMLVSSSNAVNLSDGLDGLASGLLVIASLAVIVLAAYQKNNSLLIFSICLLGALFAFLCYNFNPAKVFMGNTGSLALGATLANMFILLKMEVLLIVVGFVFVLEALSVILQVSYFKLTKGKRIFKMAPLHHHFELKGYKEVEVVMLFWFLGILCATIGIILGIEVFI
jgi:phospho-N-acetylmuramoyl-pentapeptide-transferase